PLTGPLTFQWSGRSMIAAVITRTFKVPEIHCTNCENTIRTALSKVSGVSAVVPSSANNDVKVSFDDTKVTEEQLRARLEEVGFAPIG
ncbi:MAG: heavy-metal-associated domain-containing protein, partial [Actinobacteria bacterium]|nr:heavy-metal-associated domain-containing protein [Actinomycetota bacterium]